MYVYKCVCWEQRVKSADGQHRLVLVWGLDQRSVIITESPPLCFRDPFPMSFDL